MSHTPEPWEWYIRVRWYKYTDRVIKCYYDLAEIPDEELEGLNVKALHDNSAWLEMDNALLKAENEELREALENMFKHSGVMTGNKEAIKWWKHAREVLAKQKGE